MRKTKIGKALLLAALALLAISSQAQAQNFRPGSVPPPGFGYGGYGGYGGWGVPYMGNLGPGYFLQGAASTIDATGDLYVKQEQARITREQANQAKLDTKRKAFDQRLYEKANTQTFTETQEQNESFRLRRIMNNATENEIKSGIAMNTMLPYLKDLTNHGVMGPTVPLDPDILRYINVTGATQDGSLGLLSNGGKMDWPLVLRGPTTRSLDKLLPEAVAATRDGSIDFAMYRKVKSEVEKLGEENRKKFHREEIDGGEYLTGKRYLDSLESAVKLLDQPMAKKVLNGDIKATGSTVPELVLNMTNKGLKFAPATPGYESPYYGLFNSMVTYASGAMGSSSFRVAVAPAQPRSFISKNPNISGSK